MSKIDLQIFNLLSLGNNDILKNNSINNLFIDNSIFLGSNMDSHMIFNSGRSPVMNMMEMFSQFSMIEMFSQLFAAFTEQMPFEGSRSRAQGFEGERYLNDNHAKQIDNVKESLKYHGEQLKTLDTNEDGKVDLEEAREAVGYMADYIDMADGKDDKKITIWENLALSLYQDKDKDGEITPEEQDEFMAKYEDDPYSVTRGVRRNYEKYVKHLRENYDDHGTIEDRHNIIT